MTEKFMYGVKLIFLMVGSKFNSFLLSQWSSRVRRIIDLVVPYIGHVFIHRNGRQSLNYLTVLHSKLEGCLPDFADSVWLNYEGANSKINNNVATKRRNWELIVIYEFSTSLRIFVCLTKSKKQWNAKWNANVYT